MIGEIMCLKSYAVDRKTILLAYYLGYFHFHERVLKMKHWLIFSIGLSILLGKGRNIFLAYQRQHSRSIGKSVRAPWGIKKLIHS